MKHTPGPWVIKFRNDHSAYISMGNPLEGPHKQFCLQFDGRDPSDVADANLMEVAPELLEVARLLALATDEGDDAAQGTHYVDRDGRIRCKGSFLGAIQKARAAIAKVESSQE